MANWFLGWWFLALVVVIALISQRAELLELVNFNKSGAAPVRQEVIPTVTVEPVRKVSIPFEIAATGELLPVREEQALSPVSGYIDKLNFKIGDTIAAGQAVVTFKIGEARKRLEQVESTIRDLQAPLREKEARLVEAEKQLEKLRDLFGRDLIAKKELGSAKTLLETARAERDLVKNQMDQQEAILAQLRYVLKAPLVTAPLTGVVTDVFAEANAYVQNNWPILSVAVVDPLKLSLKLSEKEALVVRKGMGVVVTAQELAEKVFQGQVVLFDAKERVAEIQVPNRQRQLRPWMGVSYLLKSDGNRDALLVPSGALVRGESKTLVYVVTDTGQAEAVPVTVRAYRDGMSEVVDGLEEHQSVVVSAPERLAPQSKVRVTVAKPQPR
ncbi:MAG: efflux RND transporter periplasmic adaptor subunit [Deltaproteobacteria bacterium]|nr:efflux RND transporter periplasmic adaptor subunit [Deltaproteobacteria bacterium]